MKKTGQFLGGLAVVRVPDGWYVVRRTINPLSGEVTDRPIANEGPYCESQAEIRAMALAAEIADKEREKKLTKDREYKRRMRDKRLEGGDKPPSPRRVKKQSIDAMVAMMRRTA